jgi:hypothetical protein
MNVLANFEGNSTKPMRANGFTIAREFGLYFAADYPKQIELLPETIEFFGQAIHLMNRADCIATSVRDETNFPASLSLLIAEYVTADETQDIIPEQFVEYLQKFHEELLTLQRHVSHYTPKDIEIDTRELFRQQFATLRAAVFDSHMVNEECKDALRAQEESKHENSPPLNLNKLLEIYSAFLRMTNPRCFTFPRSFTFSELTEDKKIQSLSKFLSENVMDASLIHTFNRSCQEWMYQQNNHPSITQIQSNRLSDRIGFFSPDEIAHRDKFKAVCEEINGMTVR